MESKSGKSKFTCLRCGACCSWPGYVILSADEADAIAAHLGLATRDFLAKFAKLTSSRKNLSLKEKENGECIFFDPEGKSCQIYGVRPSQCRRFPLEWNFPGWEKECKGGQEVGDR